MGANLRLLSKDLWVSRVIASQHKERICYLNGYRWDDFSVYVYLSDMENMESIANNIPVSP